MSGPENLPDSRYRAFHPTTLPPEAVLTKALRRGRLPHHILPLPSLGRDMSDSEGAVQGRSQQTVPSSPICFIETQPHPFLCVVCDCLPATVAK